jgi:LacI family transcriptional regulator
MPARVLLVLHTDSAWSRGVLRGFMRQAHPHGWEVLHYHPHSELPWLLEEHTPDVVVVGATGAAWPKELKERAAIVVNEDRSAEGIASVCLDEQRISTLAFEHLAARGLRHVTSFRFGEWQFGRVRDGAFRDAAARAGAVVVPGWVGGPDDRSSIEQWLRKLPKPCGVYVCCDRWGRVVTQYARSSGQRIPEDLCLVGVDNDTLECELIVPPLSSVAVPWQLMGESVAELVHRSTMGNSIAGQRIVVAPVGVVARRSSDVLAIGDAEVRRAVWWIREHADRRMSVPTVVAAIGSARQRLERLFRAHLGRTIMQEIRRAHVEAAKQLLATTDLPLPEVAHRSGFTTSALLNQAFHREVGLPPGEYRRRTRGVLPDPD